MRAAVLLSLMWLGSALADRVSVSAVGLPAATRGDVLIGQVTVPFGGTGTVASGTYTVTPKAIADGGKVYVAPPIKVAVKGNTKITLNYAKLPPGSPDPFYGKSGMQQVGIKGLETYDNWQVRTSGSLPIITTAGSFRNVNGALVSLGGKALGATTTLTSNARPLEDARFPTALLGDRDGYLAGLSYMRGTVIRFNAQGQVDPTWKVTPEQGIYVRGLVRLPDGTILAYGGQTAAALWLMDANGLTVGSFGTGGILEIPGTDQFKAGVSLGRVLDSGVVRLTLTYGKLLQLADVKEGQVILIGGPVNLPGDASSPVILADGKVILATQDVLNKKVQLVRITAEGRVDSTFSSPVISGVLSTAGLAIQLDGKTLVALRMEGDRTGVMRFLPDGRVDQGFGKGGQVLLEGRAQGIEVGPDGKSYVVMAGLAEGLDANSAFIRVVRLLTD